MQHETAVLDQLIQVILDRSACRASGADNLLDLDLSALLGQFAGGQGKFTEGRWAEACRSSRGAVSDPPHTVGELHLKHVRDAK